MWDGKPRGAKCWECGSTKAWKENIGYNNKTRTERSTRNTSLGKIKNMIKTMRANADTENYDERIDSIDAPAREVELLEQETKGARNVTFKGQELTGARKPRATP